MGIKEEIGLAMGHITQMVSDCKEIKTHKYVGHEEIGTNDTGFKYVHRDVLTSSTNIENAYLSMELINHWLIELNTLVDGKYKSPEIKKPKQDVPEYVLVNNLIIQSQNFKSVFELWIQANTNHIIQEPINIREICLSKCYSLIVEVIFWLKRELEDIRELDEDEIK